jgi:hypothetical protein
MSVQVQVSETIERPVATVFRFYAHDHVRNHPRWDPDMSLEQITVGPIGMGTVLPEGPTHTRLTISAEFLGMDESLKPTISGLMGRTLRNIKQLIESET